MKEEIEKLIGECKTLKKEISEINSQLFEKQSKLGKLRKAIVYEYLGIPVDAPFFYKEKEIMEIKVDSSGIFIYAWWKTKNGNKSTTSILIYISDLSPELFKILKEIK